MISPHGLAPYQLGMWTCPFLTGPFPVGIMDWPLSGWGYGLAPFQLGTWTRIWYVDLWNPKYAGHIFKVTVGVDMLGNIVWICLLAPRTSADILIWDGYGPSCTRGDFFGFEVGSHDGAYKGCVHVIVPFIGLKNDNLSAWQTSTDVHGW